MKKIFLTALLALGILFTGSSLFAGPTLKMKVLIDVETGKIEVFKVYGEKEILVKPIPVKELSLNKKNIVSIPDYTVIRTHSSPGCVTYFYNGYAYQVCN